VTTAFVMDPGLSVKLDQIRSQVTSKLENQANVLDILVWRFG